MNCDQKPLRCKPRKSTAGHETMGEVRQISISTPDESFTLGLQEGDQMNAVTGSLEGTLIAVHVYGLRYENHIHAYPTESPSSATASGFVKLTLVKPVPALGGMGRAVLVGLLLIGMPAAIRSSRNGVKRISADSAELRLAVRRGHRLTRQSARRVAEVQSRLIEL